MASRCDLLAPSERETAELVLLEAVDDLPCKQPGVTVTDDSHLAGHLANDDLDLLVVNQHTLRAINALHTANEINLNGTDTADANWANLLWPWPDRIFNAIAAYGIAQPRVRAEGLHKTTKTSGELAGCTSRTPRSRLTI